MGLFSTAIATAAPVAQPVTPAAPAAPTTGLASFSSASTPTVAPSTTLGVTPFPHQQVVGEAVAAGHRAIGIFDEMGVGKTLSAILAIETAQAYPALVIVPPTLVLNWKREFQRAVRGRTVATVSGTTAGVVPPTDVVIVPDSVVAAWSLTPDPDRKGHTLARGPLAVHPWGAVVQDEAHRSKNSKAQRTKAVVGICKNLKADALRLLMTGTPMLNRPDELIPVLDALGVLKPVFGGGARFKYRYCRFDNWGKVVGADNVEELHQMLKQVAIRRLRKDVLTLPNKGRGILRTEMTAKYAREYKLAEQNLVDYLRGIKGDKYSLSERAHAITLLNVLRRLSGLAKVESAIQQAEDLLAEGEQVFLACWHKDVADALALRLMKHGVSVLTGETSPANRQKVVDDFQSGKNKVFVGNIESAGVGITLTAARHILVVELPWTPAALQQVEDRLHRIGQQREVISTLVLSDWQNGSVDDRLWNIIDGKAHTVNAIMDGVATGIIDDGNAVSAVLDSYR